MTVRLAAARARRTDRSAGVLLAAALAVLPSAGCASAVKHPAITAGIVGSTLGFGTCKLASDGFGACLAVGGGAGAFLAIVAATAIWLGGEGNTVMVEEQAQPLPDERPRTKRPASPDGGTAEPAVDPAATPTPPPPATASPPTTAPAPSVPATNPASSSPPSSTPVPASPPSPPSPHSR